MKKGEWPCCEEPLKDGTPCDRAVARGDDGGPADLCPRHAKLSTVEAVEDSGETPGPERPSPDEDLTDASFQSAAPEPVVAEPEAVPITSLRAALRGEMSTSVVADLMSSMLLEALQSSREIFSTCPDCKHRHPVSIPDFGTRMKAAESLLEQVEGRLEQRAKDESKDLLAVLERTLFESLTDAELELYIAADGDRMDEFHGEIRELAQRVLEQPADPYQLRDLRHAENEAHRQAALERERTGKARFDEATRKMRMKGQKMSSPRRTGGPEEMSP